MFCKVLAKYRRYPFVQAAGLTNLATLRTLSHNFAKHLLWTGYDIRTLQDPLGHANVASTMICTQVQHLGGGAVWSPLVQTIEVEGDNVGLDR